ncbi:MAG: hypothetical protein AUK29_06070 [Nitrospirae bacterium CG2_30_53_67]|nr:MAG: hypothetical protein AUK29_06070 [Nitrospirae bacterium CG2_30_53_67]
MASPMDLKGRASGGDDPELGECIVDAFEFSGPVGVLVDFVEADPFTAQMLEFFRDFVETAVTEQEMVCLNVEGLVGDRNTILPYQRINRNAILFTDRRTFVWKYSILL